MVSIYDKHRVMHRKEVKVLYLLESITHPIYFKSVAPQTIYKIRVFDRLVYSVSNW